MFDGVQFAGVGVTGHNIDLDVCVIGIDMCMY